MIPSRAAALPLATPGLADGQGCATPRTLNEQEKTMAAPKFVEIDPGEASIQTFRSALGLDVKRPRVEDVTKSRSSPRNQPCHFIP
jgi:hypothetical protein